MSEDDIHPPKEDRQGDVVVGQCAHVECKVCVNRDECAPFCKKCSEMDEPIMTTKEVATLISILSSGMIATFGVKSLPKGKGLADKLFCFGSNFFRSVNHATRFFVDILTLVKRMISKFFLKSEGLRMERILSHNKAMLEHYKEIIHLMSQLNSTQITQSVQGQRLYLAAYFRALQYKQDLVFCTENDIQDFKKTNANFIAAFEENATLATSGIVRREPFLIKYWGPTAVGKSFRAQLDAIDAHKHVKKRNDFMSDIMLTVSYNEFLNGYKGQPILFFDEIFATKDTSTAATRAQMLMAIKSSVPFNANMARIEEKDRFIKSELVVMCDNNVFYTPAIINDRDALLRRCNMLVGQRFKLLPKHVEMGKHTTTDQEFDFGKWGKLSKDRVQYTDYTSEELDSCECYEYTIYEDVTDMNAYIKNADGTRRWFTHEEYLGIYKISYQLWAEKQDVDVARRLNAFQTQADGDKIPVNELIERAVTKSNETYVSQRVEKELTEEKMIDEIIELSAKFTGEVEDWCPEDAVGQGAVDTAQRFVTAVKLRLKNGLSNDYGKGYCVSCAEQYPELEHSKVKLLYKCRNRIASEYFYDATALKSKRKITSCDKGVCKNCCLALGREELVAYIRKNSVCDCGEGYVHLNSDPSFIAETIQRLKQVGSMIGRSVVRFYDLFPRWSLFGLYSVLQLLTFKSLGVLCGQKAFDGAVLGAYVSNIVLGNGSEPIIEYVAPHESLKDKVAQPIYYTMKEGKEEHCKHALFEEDILKTYTVDYLGDAWELTDRKSGFSCFLPLMICNDKCNYTKYREALCNIWAEQHPEWYKTYTERRQIGTHEAIEKSIPKEFLVQPEGLKLPKKKSFFEWVKSIGSKVLKLMLMASAVVGGVLACFGTIKCIQNIFGKKKPRGQGYAQGGTIRPTTKLSKDQVKQCLIRGDGGDQQEAIIQQNIQANVVILKSTSVVDKNVVYVRGLGFADNFVLITQHEAIELRHREKDGAKTEYAHSVENECRFIWRICPLQIKKIVGMDTHGWNLLVLILPKGRQFKNIIRYMWEAKHLANYPRMAHMMIYSTKVYGQCNMVDVTINGFISQPITVRQERIKMNERLSHMFETNYAGPGTCGSLLMSKNSRTPLFGYHVAGTGDCTTGFCVPLLRENFEAAYQTLRTIVGNGGGVEDANILATVEKSCIPFHPTKTNILPSIFAAELIEKHGFVKHTEPVPLSKSDPRWKEDISPLMKGALKHMIDPVRDFPQKFVDLAINHVAKMYINHCIPKYNVKGHISLTEAVAGMVIEGRTVSQPMKLNASAGWPWTTTAKKSKSDYIEVFRKEDGSVSNIIYDQEFTNMYWSDYRDRMNGIAVNTIYTDAIKDERKKPGKDPRVFSIGEMIQLVQYKQAYEEFSIAFISNFAKLRHAVGINVNGGDWTRLAEQMQSKGSKVFDGDFKDYGPRLPSQFVKGAFRIIKCWYKMFSGITDDPWDAVRDALQIEVVEALHIVTDKIYLAPGGIPSGHPGTTMINTIAHQILDVTVWLIIMSEQRPELATGDLFDQHVMSVSVGDDELKNVSDEVAEIYNCQTVSQVLARYDFKYTDASKSGTLKYSSLTEVSFLKCKFARHHDGFNYWAQLDKDVVEETALWIKKCINLNEASVQNMEQSLRLAYGHGQEYFDKLKDHYNQVLKRQGYPFLTLDWITLDSMVWSGFGIGDIWNISDSYFTPEWQNMIN